MWKHPLVPRRSIPCQTTYSSLHWYLEDCMLQWGDTTSLSLQLLTLKLAMLIIMSLARPSHSANLASLYTLIANCVYKPYHEGVVFLPSGLAKQSRQGKSLTDYTYFLPVFLTILQNMPSRNLETAHSINR